MRNRLLQMDSHKLVVKFFLDNPSALKPAELVPVFHGWIRERAVNDHLLVDVADYQHVPEGPGTVLVSLEANFHLDQEGGRPGLMYVRKQPAPGPFADRLRQAFQAALEACGRLEGEPSLSGRVRFRVDEVIFRINDRLFAPNTPETFAAVRPELERFLTGLYAGSTVTLEHLASPLRLFEVRVRAAGPPADVRTLLGRLGAAAAPSAAAGSR